MKRTVSSACLLCRLAGCGSGRGKVERHLVFVRATAPENAVVWIADADGGHARRLVRGLMPGGNARDSSGPAGSAAR
jgi:hypothetical protein